MISGNVVYEHVTQITNKEGTFILIKGKIEGVLITMFNVYAPPGSGWEFYQRIFDKIIMESEGIMICVGDFNLTLNPNMDSTGTRFHQSKNIAKKTRALMAELGIADVWRENNLMIKDYTYFSSPHSTYSRIDYFLMLKKDKHWVKKCYIGCMDVSDHCPSLC